MSRGAAETRLAVVYRESLNGLLRRIMVVALAIGMPVVAVMFLVLGRSDPVVAVGYPVLFVALGAYLWVLVRRPERTIGASRATLVAFETTWIVGLGVRLASADDGTAGWHALFPTVLMGLVVFVVVGFLVWGTWFALVNGGSVIAGALLAGSAGLSRADGGSAHVLDLVRYCIFLAFVTLLLHVLSRAKARLALAVAEAARAADEAHQMRELAYRDALTGIANRRRLVEELSHQAQVVAPRDEVAVVYFDLDHFKDVNDELGHAAGDEVLRLVADATSRAVRDGDLVARLGGEEFVVVAPRTSHADALVLAERLRTALREEVAPVSGVPVTASFGVDEVRPGEPASSVLERVDALMYAAKGAGRDRITSGRT